MEISVVVPAYNVEKYIKECIDSLINQDLNSGLYEVIIVNDGSTDDSLKIIEDNYGNISNVRVITKENGGLSSARNAGMDASESKYILFIDGDDILKEDFLSTLYKEIEGNKCDVVFSTYYWFFDEDGSRKLSKGMGEDNAIYSGGEICKYLCEHKNFKSEVCDDIYRLSFLRDNNIRFQEGLIYEDEVFTAQVLYSLNKAKTIQYAGYFYRQRANSITKTKNYDLSIKSIDTILNGFMKSYYKVEDERQKEFILWRSLALLEALNKNTIEAGKKLELSKELRKYFNDNTDNLVSKFKIMMILNNGKLYNKIINIIR